MERCFHYNLKSYDVCRTCDGRNLDCPEYDIDDVDLVHPVGESTGLLRLFQYPISDGVKRRNGDK